MNTNNAKTEDVVKTHRAYSIQEILAAGGPTAFGIKSGKITKQ